MKKSTEHNPVKPLAQLMANLQDPEAVREISSKIDRASQSFRTESAGIVSYRAFNDAIAGLVRHLYLHGLPIPKTLTHHAALSEGLDLLDRYYESNGIPGLDAAFLDASDEKGRGLGFVLRQLSEIIKEREVARHLNYRFLSFIDPTDRDTHKVIVEQLMEHYGPLLPDDLLTGNPGRYARYYRDLLEIVLSTDEFLTQIKSSSRTFSSI